MTRESRSNGVWASLPPSQTRKSSWSSALSSSVQLWSPNTLSTEVCIRSQDQLSALWALGPFFVVKLSTLNIALTKMMASPENQCYYRPKNKWTVWHQKSGIFGQFKTTKNSLTILTIAGGKVLEMQAPNKLWIGFIWIGGQFGTGTNLAPESIWHQEYKRVNLTPESIWHQECKRDNLGVINFDCCLWALSGPEGGRAQLLKMCIQFNILDPILICVPNIWGSYQLWLLSLGPVGPWGGEGTISKMCVQFNILDPIAEISVFFLKYLLYHVW